MSENDIIAEYVKSRFPSLLATVDFGLYKMGVGISETLNGMSKCLQNIDFEALKERLESVKEQKESNSELSMWNQNIMERFERVE